MATTDTPGAEAAAFYRQHGWYATGTVLPDELLDRANDVLSGLDADHRDLEPPASMKEFLAWPAGEPRPTRLNQYIALQYRAMADLAAHPALARTAALLTGSSRLRIFNTALIRKRPGAARQYARVGWHCDRAYWSTCSSDRMTTAWVPLQDTTVSMGTLTVLDGSHTWPDTAEISALRTARTFVTEDHDALWSRLDSLRSEAVTVDVRRIELRRGQVSFHHPLTVHGSGANHGAIARNAISVHYQDAANRYLPATEADGTPASYVHDEFVRRLPNGEPDYADPEICPPVWPPAG
ncbi:phytanoyl-CoA dioxygenase family protein [Kitasatospora sp. NPDC057015]|uniref:phytanoyl-CoA dioxygenase family protein n=1 Tax=Kitasatospora sp. NPDC057015 TaxID=3346001 RepID=UPI00363BED18